MTLTDSQKRADRKYKREKYTSINLTMKPEFKEQIKQCALKSGVPVNTFIKQAIVEKIENEHLI